VLCSDGVLGINEFGWRLHNRPQVLTLVSVVRGGKTRNDGGEPILGARASELEPVGLLVAADDTQQIVLL